MKKNYSLLLLSLATLTVGYSAAAQAEEISPPDPSVAAVETPQADRLAVPPDAIDVPVGASDTAWTDPPPPPNPAAPATPSSAPPTVEAAPTEPPTVPPIAFDLLQTVKTAADQKPVELSFRLATDAVSVDQVADEAIAPAQPVPAAPVSNADLATLPLDPLFTGDSESLVAKAVGSAEGTRTPNGDRNPAYYGHIDPGNKAWNQGSFSYQHGAASPEEADRKQLQRLQQQAAVMQATAIANGINLTLEEALNGIDLANQAPKAVLDREGYIDWLARAHAMGKTGEEAILWARIQSYIDPVTQRWNAPGLGNSEASISHDQARRMEAIARAIAVHQQPQPSPTPTPQIAKASLHTLSEEIGIARLFKEEVVNQFSPPPEMTEAPSTLQSALPDSNETVLASADLLFSLDLHP